MIHIVQSIAHGYILYLKHTHKFNVSLCGSRLRNKWQLLLTKNETPLVFMCNAILFLTLPLDVFMMWATAVAMTKFWVMTVTGIMCHVITEKVYQQIYLICTH